MFYSIIFCSILILHPMEVQKKYNMHIRKGAIQREWNVAA